MRHPAWARIKPALLLQKMYSSTEEDLALNLVKVKLEHMTEEKAQLHSNPYSLPLTWWLHKIKSTALKNNLQG